MTSELSLTELGWTPYFQSQISIENFGACRPRRVVEVHRNAVETLDTSGLGRVPLNSDLIATGVTVGDWLVSDPDTENGTQRLHRKSMLQRRAAGDKASNQLIAANIDTIFIVSSCNADLNIARMERYLALARQADIEPVIVLTKADLCPNPESYRNRAERALPGVFVVTVVATGPDVAAQLEPWCAAGHTAALLGSSGVGKSTLINALTDADAATQQIREDDSKGRHTTTRRSMYRCKSGGWVIDTPGMRSLRLADVADGVDMVFADISELAIQCKFRDCQHDTEPGCAIQNAIHTEGLDPARLQRWQKLQREDARHSETLAQSRMRERRFNRDYAEGKARAKVKKGDFY